MSFEVLGIYIYISLHALLSTGDATPGRFVDAGAAWPRHLNSEELTLFGGEMRICIFQWETVLDICRQGRTVLDICRQGRTVHNICRQEHSIGRRNPFSMLLALKEKQARSWCQSSWNLIGGFLWCGFETFELVGKGPGRILIFGALKTS